MRECEEKSRVLAKRLRRQMTRAEALLWTFVRRKVLHGTRFRRQHPVGPYVVDFACIVAKLAVEVDGGTHSTPEELAHDARRTKYLEGRGWPVLRVTNADVYDNLDGVWMTIAHHLPPPAAARPPPPQAGEE